MAENIDAERAAPCPFCGATDARTFNNLDEHGRDSFGVQCSGSDCAICGPERGSEAEAIAAWNRRTPSASTGEDGLPELPKQPEELRARWKCEDCDGTGEVGDPIDQGYFQPPERARCTSCDGAGQVECEALLPEQATEYARDAVAADRRAREVYEVPIPGDGFFGGLNMKIDPTLPPDTIEMPGARRLRANLRTGQITEVRTTAEAIATWDRMPVAAPPLSSEPQLANLDNRGDELANSASQVSTPLSSEQQAEKGEK